MTWKIGQRVKVIFPAPEGGIGPVPLPPLEHLGKISGVSTTVLIVDLDDLSADIRVDLKKSKIRVLPA